jgi:UDP-sugar pyrophosphorylase
VHGNSSISQRSALVINGRNIFLEGLSLDGTLIVNAADEAEVLILLSIVNSRDLGINSSVTVSL